MDLKTPRRCVHGTRSGEQGLETVGEIIDHLHEQVSNA